MPKPRLSKAQQVTLKSYFEKGERTLEQLSKEFHVSTKTIGKYKKLLLATGPTDNPRRDMRDYQLQKYSTNSALTGLQQENRALDELVRQLSSENLDLRRRIAITAQLGVGSEKHQS